MDRGESTCSKDKVEGREESRVSPTVQRPETRDVTGVLLDETAGVQHDQIVGPDRLIVFLIMKNIRPAGSSDDRVKGQSHLPGFFTFELKFRLEKRLVPNEFRRRFHRANERLGRPSASTTKNLQFVRRFHRAQMMEKRFELIVAVRRGKSLEKFVDVRFRVGERRTVEKNRRRRNVALPKFVQRFDAINAERLSDFVFVGDDRAEPAAILVEIVHRTRRKVKFRGETSLFVDVEQSDGVRLQTAGEIVEIRLLFEGEIRDVGAHVLPDGRRQADAEFRFIRQKFADEIDETLPSLPKFVDRKARRGKFESIEENSTKARQHSDLVLKERRAMIHPFVL